MSREKRYEVEASKSTTVVHGISGGELRPGFAEDVWVVKDLVSGTTVGEQYETEREAQEHCDLLNSQPS